MGNLKKVDHLNQVGQSDLCDISKANHLIQGVANGPLKTNGLAKFSPNFTGLAISFFSGYVRLAVAVLFTTLSRSFDFLQGEKSVKVPIFFVCFYN